MAYSITGIIINIFMVIIIFVIVALGFRYSNELTTCETRQSTFCYTILCPCDNPEQPTAPCFGYAKMPGPNGNWYCSNAPNTLVDGSGKLAQ